MFRRLGWAILALVAALAVGLVPARAYGAPPAPSGVVVVAVGDEAAAAAAGLARSLYREPALRPSIDEATARVLAGGAAPERPSAKLVELADLRRSLASETSEAATRRLLAAIGAETRARLVVAVRAGAAPETAAPGDNPHPGRPTAKVLRVETATYAGVELAAAPPNDDSTGPTFPDAVATLKGLMPPAPALAPRTAAAPSPGAKKPDAPTRKSALSSPWFWAGLGVLLTAGVTTFVVGRAAESSGDTVHMEGKVAP